LLVDPRGKFVYVANTQSNTVSIFEIDAATGTLQNVAVVNAGSLPVAAAIAADGKYLYVLNQSSENTSAYGIDSVTGELLPLAGSPFAGSGSSNSMVANPPGKRLYVGGATSIIGYRVFDPNGNLGLLPQSPFGGVSAAYGLSVDLSDSFLYAANNSGTSVSGFKVDGAGELQPLSDSPYLAGTNPTSITVVSSIH
jgi:YVTN family beta-propeller protein